MEVGGRYKECKGGRQGWEGGPELPPLNVRQVLQQSAAGGIRVGSIDSFIMESREWPGS